MKEQRFHVLAPFEIKAPTAPPHDPEMVDTGDSEIIKIAGYANFSGKVEEGDVFVDLVGDVVVPSGIDVSVWKKNPQILLQHDREYTIGRGLSVTKKKDGLYIEAEIHKGAMEEEEFYRIKSGLISYFSIGFRTLAGEMKKVGDRHAYFITKSLLLEVSLVSIPCNGESAFTLVKSLPDDQGFYAGELGEGTTQKFSASVENENHTQGEGIMLKLRDILPAATVKEMETLGLSAELDAEKEVSFADLKALLKEEIKAEIKAELKAETEAAAEEAEKAAKEAEEKAAAEEAEKAAKEAEEKAAAEEAEKAEIAEMIKKMAEQLAVLKEQATA
jgi:HK97 family phage prohead protease